MIIQNGTQLCYVLFEEIFFSLKMAMKTFIKENYFKT